MGRSSPLLTIAQSGQGSYRVLPSTPPMPEGQEYRIFIGLPALRWTEAKRAGWPVSPQVTRPDTCAGGAAGPEGADCAKATIGQRKSRKAEMRITSPLRGVVRAG
jgi:hypothetical protein